MLGERESGLKGVFELIFDSKLYEAPKKIIQLENILREKEKWTEDELLK